MTSNSSTMGKSLVWTPSMSATTGIFVVCWSRCRLLSAKHARGAGCVAAPKMLHPRDGSFKGSRHRGSTLPAPATIEDVGAGGAAAPSGIEDLGAAHREKVQKVQRT
ncbi:hypothetical protein MRX96_054002 [Rhipicephalus microplus]